MRCSRNLLWTVAAAMVIVLAGLAPQLPAQQTEKTEDPTVNLANELAAVKTSVKQQDFKTAWQHCHAILKAAREREAAALTGPDLYAIGLAHYYLVAEAFDKAIIAGGLNEEQAETARALRDYIMKPPADIKVVGHGRQVDLQKYIVAGKTTIVDFFSRYCPPCMAIAPRLEDLAQSRPDIAIVKVDINRPGVEGIDWESPTARQFNLHSIPHFKIFGPDRKLLAEGDRARALLQQWIGQ